ncbi:Brefeldin A-inhibited guanine nucleotide-exchange protein 1, partial [Linderina pennispora]
MSIYEIFGTIVQEIDLQDKQHASLASTSGTFIAPIQAAESAGQDDECGELDFAQLTQLLDQALAAGRNRSLVLSILNVLEKSLAALSSSQEALQAHNTGIRMPRDLMNKDGMYLEAWRVVDEARQYSWLYGTKTAGATATTVVAGWRALDALVSAVCKCHELMGEPYLGVARILHNLLVHAAHEMHSVAVVCALQTVKQIAVQEGSAGAAAQRALAEVVAKMCAMASGNADAQDRVCLVYCLLHGWAVAQSAPAKRRDAGILRKSSNGVLASTVTSRSIVAGQVLALDLLDLLLRNINDSTRVYPPFCMLHCSAMPGIARQCGTSTEPQVFDKALALLIALLQRPWDPLKDTLGALFKEVYLAPLQSAWAHSKMCEMANSQSHQVVAMQMAASVQQMLVMRGLMRVCGDARSLVGLLPKSRDAADSSCAFQELFNVLCRIVRVVFEAPPSTPAVTGRLHGVWSSLRGSSEVSATQSGEAEQRKIQHLRMAVMALKCLVAMVDGLGVRYNEAGIYRHTDDISISMHSLRIPESVEDAVSLFNSNPEAGLQTILQLGFIPSDCPDTVMQHLIAGVSGDTSVGKLAACKTRVSRTAMCQLAFSDESCEYLAQAFEQMQLQTQALASALSALFSVFLPDSVQQLDTLLLAFARQFCQRNCAYLNTPSEDGAEAPQDSPPKEDMSARQVGRVYILACLAVIADYEV